MIQLILKWLGGDLATALTRAYELKLNAANDTERIKADVSIKAIEAQMAANAASANVGERNEEPTASVID